MISESVERWRGAIPRLYQRPTLFADRGLTGGLVERIGFDSLLSRLLESCNGGTPLTWLVRGGPATGKSSLCAALAVASSEEGATCVLIDRRILDAHGAGCADSEALLHALRPAAAAAKKWKSDIKHGRIIVFLDGLNEIRLRYGQSPAWRLAEQLALGNHRCPVVATTRSAGEFDNWGALRAVEPVELPPFAAEQIDALLAGNGLDVAATRAAIEDAGLAEAAVNPLLLHHIVDLLLTPGEAGARLPRSRAGVLMRTFEHVSSKRGLIDPATPQAPAELAPAVAVAASLCAMFGRPDKSEGRQLRFRITDLADLLAQSWPDAAQPEWAYIPTDLHLARFAPGSTGEEAEFVHQTLIDFAVALLFRRRAPPEFLVVDRPDLGQVLGDWVGLHMDPEMAVKEAIGFAWERYRPDLLVDVAAANDGILTPALREELWTAIGQGLVGRRQTRDRTADRLAELSPTLTHTAMAHGLLAAMSSQNEPLAAAVRALLPGRRFSARTFQRALRESAWRRRQPREQDRNGRSGRFAALDCDALIALLGTATESVKRGAAATALGALGDLRAVKPLCDALKDDSPDVRGAAAMALGALRDRNAVEPLFNTLKNDATPSVRGAAATALRILGDRNAVEALCDALKGDDAPSARGAAATALGALGDRRAVKLLCDALRDGAHNVRGSAATALGAVGDRSAVPALCDALNDTMPDVRGAAATALGALGDRNAVKPLCDALKDDDVPSVRGAAATALGALGNRTAVEPLCDALRDDAPSVRGAAATALGALGDRNAVDSLREALKADTTVNVRGAAATALGALGDRNAVAPLCDALKDTDAPVRGAAATALGALGDRNAVAPLCDALKDTDAPVRGAAASALGALGDRNAVAPLCEALNDQASNVRGSAATALGALGDERAIEPLSESFSDPNDQVRLSAANALGALADHMAGEDIISRLMNTARYNSEPSVRTSAVMTLARHGRIDLPLLRYLIDPDFGRRDGRKHDTDWGVQGQTAAAVLRTYAQSVDGNKALTIVARLLSDANTHKHVLSAALAPLADMPPAALKRALADLSTHMPAPAERTARLLDELREKLARHELAEQRLAQLASSAPATLRAAFPPAPRLWLDKSKEAPLVSHTAVLLTAAPIEAKSVYEGLTQRGIPLEALRLSGLIFDEGNLVTANGTSWRVILAQPLEKGPHAMHGLVKDLLAGIRLDLLLMVGMCGGIKENGASENAVIVAKQVLNYEPQRVRSDRARLKPSNYRCDPRVIGSLNALQRRGVLGQATAEGEAAIELLTKDVASGEKLIDDLNSSERASIVALSDDLVGVETEGHGLYHPLWEDLLRGAPPPHAMIKGVSDLGDGNMRDNKLVRQRRSTLRALTVALAIIENLA